MTENLNIQHNIKILVIKALKRAKTVKEAAGLLGITARTLFNYKRKFGV